MHILIGTVCWFLTEMLDYIERRLFPDGIPAKSTMALTMQDFKQAGEVMAISILQGGQAPNLLQPHIYGYLCGNLSIEKMKSVSKRDICEKVNVHYHCFMLIIMLYCMTTEKHGTEKKQLLHTMKSQSICNTVPKT